MSQKLNKSFIGHWILLTVIFVFFFQMVSDVIEAIYTMDLLNTTLDEKVAGVGFFLTTPLLFIFWKKIPDLLMKIVGTVAIVLRLIEPFFRTPMKIWIGGASLGLLLIYIPAYMAKMRENKGPAMGLLFSISIASSSLLLILFKTVNNTIDISMIGYFQAIGWVLGAGAIVIIFLLKTYQIDESIEYSIENPPTNIKPKKKILASITGLFSILILLYFAYNSPVVFARWVEINYMGAVITLSLVYAAFIGLVLWAPKILGKIKKLYLWIWNAVFFLSLVLMIILNQTTFISTDSGLVELVYPSPWYLQILVYFNLILSPILFINIFMFIGNLYSIPMRNGRLIGAFLLNEFIFVVLIFALIFSNVWGYVEELGSGYLRGLIWIPFALIGVYTLLNLGMPNIEWKRGSIDTGGRFLSKPTKLIASSVFLIVLILNGVWAYMTFPHPDPTVDGTGITSLRIMTYNIQQGANSSGDKNFDAQLALIRDINPDIIGLQESDTAKINTGNTDVVGYFADKLNYHVYYGPRSVMQTYGCAILSRYPIQNYYSIYTYGDEDEIGSVCCEVVVGSRIFTVFVNHPAGSYESKRAHTDAMLNIAGNLTDTDNTILLGDFNWREDTDHYARVNATYLDTWRTMWPSGTGHGVEMLETIDHVFISNSTLTIVDAVYIPEPESQTDHPAYWTEISWS